MEWYTINTLQSVAGAALAVTLVTAVLKAIFSIAGRRTQLVALCLSLAIAALVGEWRTVTGLLLIVLNGCVVTATALGIDQAANYGKSN